MLVIKREKDVSIKPGIYTNKYIQVFPIMTKKLYKMKQASFFQEPNDSREGNSIEEVSHTVD